MPLPAVTPLSLGLILILAASPLLATPPHGKPSKHGADAHGVEIDLRGPSIDIDQVRVILGDNRALLEPANDLPPGIAKNLARGKPLPPGSARKFDDRLLTRLPHYQGYEWRQVGRDAVLVTMATGIVYEVLHNMLD